MGFLANGLRIYEGSTGDFGNKFDGMYSMAID